MFRTLKLKTKALRITVALITISIVILAAAGANVMVRETKTYSAANYNLQYDDSKLSIVDLGGLMYDSTGNLDRFNLTVQNKDLSNVYSGLVEASISGQTHEIQLPPIAPSASSQITIDVEPNLPVTSIVSITATVYVSDGATTPTPTSVPTQTPAPTSNPTGSPVPTSTSTLTPPTSTPTPNPTTTNAPSPTPMPIPAGVDFAAIKATAIPDAQIDGTIGTEWNDAKHYTNIPINPQGTAEIWTKNDGVNLYFAIRFTADSNNPWLTLELGSAGIHNTGADLGVFGDDNLSPNGYSDASFATAASVKADSIQNGVGAITVGAGNVITIELKKPLNSGDTTGKDISWAIGGTYTMVIAWDSNGGGSSGGKVDHTGGTTPTARTIFIGG